LIRVTGDCFRALRVPRRFAADFRVAPDRAVAFVELLRFGPRADFAALLPLAEARFDVVVFRRAVLPDDFDAVAIDRFLGEGTKRPSARFAHSIEPDETQLASEHNGGVTPAARDETSGARRPRVAESASRCGLQSPVPDHAATGNAR
jgi:hypothetical protein